MADSWTLGLRAEGGYARVYERLNRVAVVVAETEGKARRATIELDASRYRINPASANCQLVDFSGQQRPLGTKRSRTEQLRAEIDLGAWQIGALVFTHGQEVA